MSRANDATLLRDLLRQVGLDDFAPDGPVLPVREQRQAPPDPRPSRWAAWGVPGEAIRRLQHHDGLDEIASLQGARELLAGCGGAPPGKSVSQRIWCLLAGGLGSGKSTAAGWWLTQVRSRGSAPRVFIASEDVAALPKDTVWAEERFQRLFDASALVLDDVGRNDAVSGEGGRSYLHPSVQRVLNRRYDRRLPTFCTGNLHPVQDWPTYLGDERLVDRWREIGAYRGTTDASLRRGRP